MATDQVTIEVQVETTFLFSHSRMRKPSVGPHSMPEIIKLPRKNACLLSERPNEQRSSDLSKSFLAFRNISNILGMYRPRT